jgi:hypothetical protein
MRFFFIGTVQRNRNQYPSASPVPQESFPTETANIEVPFGTTVPKRLMINYNYDVLSAN